MWKEFLNLCNPSKFYFIVSMISILFGIFANFKIFVLLAKFIFTLIYTYILNFLCKKGYKMFSWFLVLLPYIVIFIVMLDLSSIKN
jgi:hypothetical protein